MCREKKEGSQEKEYGSLRDFLHGVHTDLNRREQREQAWTRFMASGSRMSRDC